MTSNKVRKPWDEVMIFKSGGIPASRSPLVHAVSRFGTGGYGSRGQDFVALWRDAGESGRQRRRAGVARDQPQEASAEKPRGSKTPSWRLPSSNRLSARSASPTS